MLINPKPFNDDEIDDDDSSGRVSPYWLIFWLVLAGCVWYQARGGIDVRSMFNPTNIRIGVIALSSAVFWTVLIMFIHIYVVPAITTWLYAGQTVKAKTIDSDDAPPPPPAVVPPPRITMTPMQQPEERRVEQTTAVIWANDHIIIGNNDVDLGDYQVSREQWDALAKARRRGQLPTISLVSLHDTLGIDRKARAALHDSDAHRVIGLLVDLELIKDNGDRRPYTFTALGESILPCPQSQRVLA